MDTTNNTKRVLLVNVDSKWNTAIRKYYTYFSNQPNTEVDMIDLGFAAYPHKKTKTIGAMTYDEVYVSNIFERNAYNVEIVGCNNVTYGGIGSKNPKLQLPKEVDKCIPYFDAEKDNGVFWTYLTRGCVRSCWFCKVGKYEGQFRVCTDIDSVLSSIPEGVKTIQFLDNNILGLGDAVLDVFAKIAEWQKTHKAKVCFNQGLDWRLVTKERLESLMTLNYDGDYTFAFDVSSYEEALNEKIQLIQEVIASRYKKADYRVRFYLYHNDTEYTISDLIHRVEWCRKHKCTCYVMRDKNCYDSEYADFYTDYAAYCNLTACFKKMNFKQFLEKRHIRKEGLNNTRINSSNEVFLSNVRAEDWLYA